MNDWASRRKTFILIGMVLLLAGVSFLVFLKFFRVTPSCSDGVMNGDEIGVDCGGSCALICSSTAKKPVVMWDPRIFEVTPALWSSLVYVENPNSSIDATYAPYTLTIYGDNNQILETRENATILPKNKTVGIFEGNILAKNGVKPRRAVFEFKDPIIWKRNESTETLITVSHGPLLQLEISPRVDASVKNESINDVKNIELVAAIFDGSDNAIAASRTFVEDLRKNTTANVVFTWPKSFDLGTKVCETPSNILLLLDRSGSMASEKKNPPEPLTAAKDAAKSFVQELHPTDRVGMVSFATLAKEPIDLVLTNDFASATKAIDNVSIESVGTQYTNIFAALHSAWQELGSPRVTDNGNKIIILLTDGQATSPKAPNGRTESDDIKYAEDLARNEALNIKRDGITIYTIGLGNMINAAFLKQLASEEKDYFFAPTSANLESIYQNISSTICKEMPARIEITYKIFGNSI